jgi:hypothetical protein
MAWAIECRAQDASRREQRPNVVECAHHVRIDPECARRIDILTAVIDEKHLFTSESEAFDSEREEPRIWFHRAELM